VHLESVAAAHSPDAALGSARERALCCALAQNFLESQAERAMVLDWATPQSKVSFAAFRAASAQTARSSVYATE
jgi:hypothetical protein